MNLKQLEVLKAVMATGSTAAAAAALDLSQPAISRQLAALETELGFALFARAKGRLVPLPEARALLPEVEDLGLVLERLKRRSGELRAGAAPDRLMRLAFPHSMTTTILPGVLRRFLDGRKGTVVEILPGPYGAIERMVKDGAADLGFTRLPAEDRSLAARPLLRSGSTCVMPEAHRLARAAMVELRDLACEDLILLGRQRSARNELEHELKAISPDLHCRVEVHSVEAACACAAAGLGVAIVPGLLAGLFRSMPIAIRPFRPPRVAAYGTLTLPGAPASRAADAFVTILLDALLAQALETTLEPHAPEGASEAATVPARGP